MSDEVSDEVLVIAALGRPFCLGTLYDCRSDRILPGVMLWDNSTLEEKSVNPLETTDSKVIASDSLDDKSSALDVSAGVKLSFLSGLIEVSGSGKYLNNRKNSNHLERVSLKYTCTVRSEEITMEQLKNGRVQHPDDFDHGTATHVVTRITYGGNAFFVFDREKSSSSHEKDIEGNLHAMIMKIPFIEISGKGELKISEDEKNEVQKVSCKYFGDFKPNQNPSSFEEAVRLYKELPSLTGENGKNAVPVKVYLSPLSLLVSNASRVARDISDLIVREIEKVLEKIYELDVRCKDLVKSQAVQRFHGIRSEIQTFKSLLQTYKLRFQKELSEILPHIRGGGKDECELANILKKKEASPFSSNALKSWLEMKEEQVKILSQYTTSLSKVKFASEIGDLQAYILNPELSHILWVSILLPKCRPYLEQMQRCISEGQHAVTPTLKDMNFLPFTEVDNKSTMMEKARVFRDFYEANKDNSSTGFIVGEESCDSVVFQANVRHYANGKLVHKDFEIPSPPRNVTVVQNKITHESIFVKWDKPLHGASSIREYRVICEPVIVDGKIVSKYNDLSDTGIYITGLEAGHAYQVSIRSVCDIGVSPWSKVNQPVKTKPTSPPGKPVFYDISFPTFAIEWEKPSTIGAECIVLKYVVEQKEKETDWYRVNQNSNEDCRITFDVYPNVAYRFKIYCDCGHLGKSLNSEVSEELYEISQDDYLKRSVCNKSELLNEGQQNIFKLGLNRTYYDPLKQLQKFEFGSEKHGIQEKVIMLVGATGSGKTTLIHGIINYIFSIEWKDKFRFKLITEPHSHNQAISQTSMISSYTIYHQVGFRVPYSLTIIDTPGFGDVKGIERDKEISEQIRCFFIAGGAKGIDHIDAVGFVAQSSLARLTATQRYIFDQILSLFGKDIKENIFLLLTFADGKKPQVLSGIKEAELPYQKYFKVNNSVLYQEENDENIDDGGDFDEMFWQMGQRSFMDFLAELNTTESKSLSLTKDVLYQRNMLETSIEGIQLDIKQGLSKLEQLKQEVEVVMTHKADMDRNKNFKYPVNEEVMKKVKISEGEHITNCLTCNRSCHHPCKIADDSSKASCWAMTDGNCRICACKGHWSIHKNFPYKYVSETRTVIKTAEDLRKRYQEANEKKLSAEALVEKVEDEFKAVKIKVLGLIDTVRKSLDRLKEIALKPSPLSTVDYIDILIQTERSQPSPGWQERVSQLQNVKEQAEYLMKVSADDFEPFPGYAQKIKEEEQQGKGGIWFETKKVISNIVKDGKMRLGMNKTKLDPARSGSSNSLVVYKRWP